MKTMKRALVATAVGMALAGTAYTQVLFDVDGAGGANKLGVDRFRVTLFDWVPNNIVLTDITPIGVAAVTSVAGAPIFSQATLGTLGSLDGSFSYSGPGELTYQLSVFATYSAGTADGTTVIKAGPLKGLFSIYHNATADNSSDITGCGYGTLQDAVYCGSKTPGKLIYTGTTTIRGSATLTDTGGTPTSLDTAAPDVDEGITTTALSMNTLTIDINTTFQDGTYFLSDIGGLTADLEHTETGGVAPFSKSVNPSDQVGGYQISRPDATGVPLREAAYGFDLINNTGGGSCGVDPVTLEPAGPCDVHLASDASTTVQALLPEPHSLALLGLGLGIMGFGARRRVRRFFA